MNNAIMKIKEPLNEAIMQYLPGSIEARLLEEELERQLSQKIEIPLIIGGKEIYTGLIHEVIMPTDHGHVLALCHQATEKEMKMAYTLKKLNTVIYHAVYSAKFISLFYAELEKNGNIIYANAGHPGPLLFDGEKFSVLEPTGLIIGAFPKIDISRSYAKLHKGGILVMFTDGIIERKNRRSELFEIERLKSVIAENKDQSADTILHRIFEAAEIRGFSFNHFSFFNILYFYHFCKTFLSPFVTSDIKTQFAIIFHIHLIYIDSL